MITLRSSRFGVGLLLLSLHLGQAAQSAPPPATVAALAQAISNHISQPKFAAASWGVKIVSLESGATLFEHNSRMLFSPASNSKLYTVALGLDRLGPDYRIRTSLYSQTPPSRRGTLRGDLILYGRGDPTLNARLNGGDILKALEPLVFALTNAGVRRVSGDLVADASFIRGPEFGSGWSWDDAQYYYGAEISALTINDNILQVTAKPGRLGEPCQLTLSPPTDYLRFENRTRTVAAGERRALSFYRPLGDNLVYVTGSIPVDDPGLTEDLTVHDPAGLFGRWFRQALARHGVKVSGKIRSYNWLTRPASLPETAHLHEIAFVESPPLRDIAREIQKPSQNLYTDLLLAHLGEHFRTADTPSRTSSEDLGIRELNRFLGQIGIPRGEVLFEEGSGLSRNNLTTPNATVALLQYMHSHPAGAAYLEALPIAGVDGTLRRRMTDTPAAGNVRAKTGTLRWANSLSGHVTTAAGERLIFSLMLNRYYNTNPAVSTRADLDAIAVWLAGFAGRSDGAAPRQ
ncbi:MAG TPA: D-alanyl-D-alanine carboxypeptidase/D-alanyl-D-alanine-endopeptidase [Verrucomicrobiota bacterium]|jgi:D-alanyl-D-alanine carboxypeptidase/D-alanyl-D-alanine-endopeptidase (penicillin-binding protein 4)|nr:D-alanyl-D-alanine carboxypeptidase/D-alanyl-D-alanine-endopeptidase [Verrucomicrobiota bacterium]